MKEKYLGLKKKHNLPSFDDLNRDFEIQSISKDDDVLREILKKMGGVVEFHIGVLEDIIQPDSRYYALKEANFLDKTQRDMANLLYGKLMYLNRKSIELNLDYSEDGAASFIIKMFEDWQTIKKELLPIIVTLKESWSKKTEIKLDGGYFG